ncbi:hypothetical protein BS78_07G027000 [Paspalum vaginatum]|nr:hypothetical protein BS78_07G027000 [Paspalum vaginatum]
MPARLPRRCSPAAVTVRGNLRLHPSNAMAVVSGPCWCWGFGRRQGKKRGARGRPRRAPLPPSVAARRCLLPLHASRLRCCPACHRRPPRPQPRRPSRALGNGGRKNQRLGRKDQRLGWKGQRSNQNNFFGQDNSEQKREERAEGREEVGEIPRPAQTHRSAGQGGSGRAHGFGRASQIQPRAGRDQGPGCLAG